MRKVRLRYMSNRAYKLIGDLASESDEEETPTLRFNAHLLKYFLEGLPGQEQGPPILLPQLRLGDLECVRHPYMHLLCANAFAHQPCLIRETEICANGAPSGSRASRAGTQRNSALRPRSQ